jgi:TetR/AcrR family transcriptional repressor of nem operon
MGKATTKEVLLDAGRKAFLERGYNHAGIESILQSAGVPKGSFYHYFGSKEEFGIEVLNQFAALVGTELDQFLNDASLPPIERLKRHGEAVCSRLDDHQCRNGCLVGNLSQEMSDQSEAFRARLDEIMRDWRDRYANCLGEAQHRGEIAAEIVATDLADFWLSGWQGAILRSKTARTTAPLRTFLKIMFEHVLRF